MLRNTTSFTTGEWGVAEVLEVRFTDDGLLDTPPSMRSPDPVYVAVNNKI